MRRSFPPPRWNKSSTTPEDDGGGRTVRVTHPFHPLSGQVYVFAGVHQTWGEHRVFFLDEHGGQHSMPVGWTDIAEPDAFVLMAEGRSPFRVSDLVALARLIEQQSNRASRS